MRLLLFLSLLSTTFMVSAQLPESWLGHYVGELKSVDTKGKETTFHMELSIDQRADSSYNFTIVYGEDTLRQERAYLLSLVGINRYYLDEQNGIVLDMMQTSDRLVSIFEVSESLLHVSYIFTDHGIRFELTSSKKGHFSGGTVTDSGEEIPTVQSYRPNAFQHAELKKQK